MRPAFGIATATFCATVLLAAAPPLHAQLARELGLLPPAAATAAETGILPTESRFALEQLRHERVQDARVATRFAIKRLYHEQGIAYPAAEIFMRIFKRERSLEVWARAQDTAEFALLKTYDICALAGELGPKRRQGDNQTPEGFYFIDFFNPRSEFHLSLHLDYPNRRDRTRGLEGVSLGGDIYIHGGCSSEGCLALTDAGIRELYWLSVEARAGGQQRIPVHIFPARLDDRDFEILTRTYEQEPELGRFWSSLKPGYDYFEQNRRVPAIALDANGDYRVSGFAEDVAPLGTPLSPVVPAERPKPATGGAKPPLGSPVGGG